jgi:hypothetical protein
VWERHFGSDQSIDEDMPLKPCISGNMQGANTSYISDKGNVSTSAQSSMGAASYSTTNTSGGVVCPYATLGRDNKTWINRAPMSEFSTYYT